MHQEQREVRCVLSRRRVLVVEDDSDLREMMCLMLEHEGYACEAVSDGAEALLRLRADGPRAELILLDLMMPRMDGWQFCRAQASDPALARIPLIVVSASPAHPEPPSTATAVVAKPVDHDVLLSTIRELCG